jgi:type II secretory pathway pseudopilin PulG
VVSLLAILHFIGGPLMVLGGGIMLVASPSSDGGALMTGLGLVYLVLGALSLVCGIGLWKLKGYGRTIQIVFSVIGLLGIPVGTVISILILVYMNKPGVKVLFSETPPARLSAADIAEVQKLSESSGLVVGLVAVAVLLVGVALVGIIAAIAIPSLLRARMSANEASVIGDLRSIISAQAAYSASNGGFYDQLECLARPQDCIPGYPAEGPTFLQEVPLPVKNGYQREFRPGTPGEGTGISPSSVSSFVYLAYPAVPGTTGSRAFCADQTGRICVTMDGSMPPVVDGQCDPACVPLQ